MKYSLRLADGLREPRCLPTAVACNDLDFRKDTVDTGEIGDAGNGTACSTTALYAVTFRPHASGCIATVQLRWEDPETHNITDIAPKPVAQPLALAYTPGVWPSALSRPPPLLSTGCGSQHFGARYLCSSMTPASISDYH